MSVEVLFSVCNTLVLPQWLLLLFAPRWKWTQRLRDSYILPLLLAIIYGYLILTHIGTAENGGFSTLLQVKNLFANDFLLLAGWIHYLAFDLLVGSWMARDARQQGVNHFLVVPCLLFAFMLGPMGFLLYQVIKRLYVQNLCLMKMRNFFSHLHQRNPWLSVTGWIHVVLLLVFLLLMPFDSRIVTSVNPWMKPAKFALSIIIFAWTMACLLYYLRDKPHKIKRYSLLFAITLYVEMAIIAVQAARGTTSHFNVFSSPLNAILFSVMGIFITINLVVTIALFIDFLIQKTTLSSSMLWAIRLGLLVMILGSLEGFTMIKLFSHTVGAADGGPGLPVVKWSTVAGDLRIAHFLGCMPCKSFHCSLI
jgi:hypothetical protein